MKIIQNIDVTVTYSVELSNVEVQDDIYDALVNNEGYEFDCNDPSLSEVEQKALDWICDHIHESDAYDWQNTINNID